MAKTGHPNFDYTCTATWRGNAHRFSITGNHSGTSFGQTDAQAFMEGETSPYGMSFGPFQSPAIKVVESRYYDGQNSAPVYAATYDTDNPAPTPLQATGLAYAASPAGPYLPLEMCVMLQAEVGNSSTSKPIYCRKFLRGTGLEALSDAGIADATFEFLSAATDAATAMGSGAWYGGRVYISPSARQALTGWSVETQVYNHQVPRGRKRKASTTANSSAYTTIEKIIALAGGVALAGA